MAIECLRNSRTQIYFIHLEETNNGFKVIAPNGSIREFPTSQWVVDDDGECVIEEVAEDLLTPEQLNAFRIWEIQSAPNEVYEKAYKEFRVSLNDYNELIRPGTNYKIFKINVQGGANHPDGYYAIPKLDIVRKIQSGEWEPHWSDHDCHSDSNVPTEFRRYWHPG